MAFPSSDFINLSGLKNVFQHSFVNAPAISGHNSHVIDSNIHHISSPSSISNDSPSNASLLSPQMMISGGRNQSLIMLGDEDDEIEEETLRIDQKYHSELSINHESADSNTNNISVNNNFSSPALCSTVTSNLRTKATTAQRRATHNAIERARRESLNGRFLELAKALPTMSNVKRPSKSVIVNKSLEWIRESQAREFNLTRENHILRDQVNKLRAKLNLPRLPFTIDCTDGLDSSASSTFDPNAIGVSAGTITPSNHQKSSSVSDMIPSSQTTMNFDIGFYDSSAYLNMAAQPSQQHQSHQQPIHLHRHSLPMPQNHMSSLSTTDSSLGCPNGNTSSSAIPVNYHRADTFSYPALQQDYGVHGHSGSCSNSCNKAVGAVPFTKNNAFSCASFDANAPNSQQNSQYSVIEGNQFPSVSSNPSNVSMPVQTNDSADSPYLAHQVAHQQQQVGSPNVHSNSSAQGSPTSYVNAMHLSHLQLCLDGESSVAAHVHNNILSDEIISPAVQSNRWSNSLAAPQTSPPMQSSATYGFY